VGIVGGERKDAKCICQVIDGLHLRRLQSDLADFGAGTGNGSIDLNLDDLALDDLGLFPDSNPDAFSVRKLKFVKIRESFLKGKIQSG
jgi:hypothetical protein